MRIAARVASILGGIFLGLLALCLLWDMFLGDRSMPPWSGKVLPEPRSRSARYRVAVLGDVQKGITGLKRLLEVIKGEGVDLVIQTGDLVSTNDEGHFRLVALVLERSRLERPFFVIPGNHDVKGSPERFVRAFGRREWSFLHGGVLFVGLDNAEGRPPDLDRLRRIVEPAARGPVVLAMHVPPFNKEGRLQSGYEPFLEWLKKSPVRYLLSGHIHNYMRRKIGDTVVIANGVGGDSESWDFKQEVYATLLEVDGEAITDRVIKLPPEHHLVDSLEHLAIGHVGQAYRAHPWWCWSGTLLIAGLAAFAAPHVRKRAPGTRMGQPAGAPPAPPP